MKPGPGRPKGLPNKQTVELRQLMEKVTPGHEPVPLTLLKIGLQYYKQGKDLEAISAISKAIQYAYPQLKAIEHSGQIDTAPVLNVIIGDNAPLIPAMQPPQAIDGPAAP